MIDLEKIKTIFTGRVIGPADPDFDQVRAMFYGGIDLRPQVIIQAAGTDDVSKAVMLARDQNLELAVRGGGHSLAGHSLTEGGLVIDLRNMKKLEIDTDGQAAWAEAGLTAAEVGHQVDAHDLVIGFGDTGSVGIGGITLGGGVGFLVRKYGLTIDNLLAAEIVTADGKVLMADMQTNQDLFWAIRGGGGNFGVATRFQYRLHPIGQVYGGLLILPATAGVISGYMSEAAQAPDELSSILNIMPAPPMPFLPRELHGQLIAMALVMYAGDPKTGESVLAPFRALARPLSDMVKPMHYPEIFFPEDPNQHPTAVVHTMFMKSVETETAKTIIEALQASDAPMRAVQLRPMGGAMSRVPVEATAFAHRTSKIMANVAAFYQGSTDKLRQQTWVSNLAGRLKQGDNGAYAGFLGDEGAERIRAAYPGKTLERLAGIKRRYDAANLFHLNQNIAPDI